MPDEIKPRPILRVGIVGHTVVADERSLKEAIKDVLEQLREAAGACFNSHTAKPLYRAGCDPEFRFVSNLAPGADRIATEAALAERFDTTVVLPMPRAEYERKLSGPQRAEFTRVIGHADLKVLELPGPSNKYGDQAVDAYALAARVLIDHVDVLIAAWAGPDGELARPSGPSLTQRAIDLASERNVPVVWIPIPDADGPPAEPLPRHLAHAMVAGQSWTIAAEYRRALEKSVRALLDPYDGAASPTRRSPWRRALEQLWHHLRRVRPEHLMEKADSAHAKRDCLDAAVEALGPDAEPAWLRHVRGFMQRVSPFQRAMARATATRVAVRGESAASPTPPPSVLRQALPTIEVRARQIMGRYRASFSWIFTLGAVAVALAVTAYLCKPLQPALGKTLAVLEVGTVLTILGLHLSAHTQRWQQRAIDLRLVVEILRQATWVSLAWLVIPRPRLGGHLLAPGEPLRWSQWYAQAWLRDHHFGLLDKSKHSVTQAELVAIRGKIVDGLIVDQKNWYEAKCLDHRIFLERMHTREVRLFVLVLAACCAALVLVMGSNPDQVQPPWFQVAMGVLVTVTAAFPAFAAAAHGISAQAELQGIAQAYRRMTATLDARENALLALDPEFTLAELQREVAVASNAMLAEVQDWHRSYGVHPPPLA